MSRLIGIDAVKDALRAGIAVSTEEVPIKINLIAPPLYVMTTSTPEKADGLKLMDEAWKAIETKIKEAGGQFSMKKAPKVVTATDEADLAKLLERAEQENAEVRKKLLKRANSQVQMKTLSMSIHSLLVTKTIGINSKLPTSE